MILPVQHREKLRAESEGALIVMTAYDSMQQSGDMAAPFLQESSFWWLTGIDEPGWKLIFDTLQNRSILVRPHRDEVDMIFNGGYTNDDVLALSGADTIIDACDFERELRRLHRHHAVVQTISNKHGSDMMIANPAQSTMRATLERIFDSVQDCEKLILRVRAIKSADEIERIKKAVAITTRAFQQVRESLDSYRHEYEIEAEFTYRFRQKNAIHAYEPIVAGGPRACTLHYIANDAPCSAREMVLIDIGARYGGYAADVTRTYCRRPTKRQRQVHAAVERAHQAIIACIKPGLPVAEYIQYSDMVMKRALTEIGLLANESDQETFRKYFPHAVSHGLGVDVHDTLGAARYLQPGMVLTVEPGIYIPEEGIGVRIEDDILVTDRGHINLSGNLSTGL